MHLIPNEDEQLRIALALWGRIKAGTLGKVWIEGRSVRIEVAKWQVHPISWDQARRLAEGAAVGEVVTFRKGPTFARPGSPGEERCA